MAGKSKAAAPAADYHAMHGYAPEQLCRVKRVPQGTLKPGALLAFNGCWQNKAVVVSVTYVGVGTSGEHNPTLYHRFAVVIAPLGKYFADGRQQPTPPRAQVEREILVCTDVEGEHFYGMGRWHVVEPIAGPLLPPLALRFNTKAPYVAKSPMHAEFQGNHSGNALPVDAATAEAMAANAHLLPPKPGYKPATPPKPRAPEAVLADFLIQ